MSAAGSADGAKSPTSAPAKVLVVDDTPLNVKLLTDLLGVKGYAVSSATERRRCARQASRPKSPTLCCSIS